MKRESHLKSVPYIPISNIRESNLKHPAYSMHTVSQYRQSQNIKSNISQNSWLLSIKNKLMTIFA